MPELKPCPFCGDAVICVYDLDNKVRVLTCGYCGMEFSAGTQYEDQPNGIFEAWNRRAGDDQSIFAGCPKPRAAAKTQRGEWINGCECSVCGQAYGPRNRNQAKNYRYCTYCGAKMDGGNG